jgi:hypothetical protein
MLLHIGGSSLGLYLRSILSIIVVIVVVIVVVWILVIVVVLVLVLLLVLLLVLCVCTPEWLSRRLPYLVCSLGCLPYVVGGLLLLVLGFCVCVIRLRLCSV